MELTFILNLIQMAVKSGMLSTGTALLLVIFCVLVIWFGKKQSNDFNNAIKQIAEEHERSITELKESSLQTISAIREQVDIEKRSNQICQNRYDQIRSDMAMVQSQVTEMNKQIWLEVLTYLRNH